MAGFPLLPWQSRNILLIGDEGVTIYESSSRNVRYIDQIDWVTPDFESKLTHVLVHDCGNNPVVMLYDMVEQYYRKELIPDVGMLDKKNVLERKLAITFPNYKYRAAQAFRGKSEEKKKSKKDTEQSSNVSSLKTLPYLFAAVPASELLSALVRAVLATSLPIKGFYLLPVEGTAMISRITKKLYSSGEMPGWTLYIGQHSGGNLRQVIVKDDQLALTRMTPFSQSQEDPATWAANVLQEYKVTASYLSRLGYKPEDRLNVVLIGPKGAQAVLEEALQDTIELKIFSIQEAAKLANVSTKLNQTEEYADVLFAAWAGQASSYSLPVNIPEFENVIMPRRVANFAILAFFLGSLWFGHKFVISGMEMMDLQSKMNANTTQISSLEREYNGLLDTHKELGYDVRLFRGAFLTWEELNAYSIRPFKLLNAAGESLGNLALDDLIIRHEDGTELKLQTYDSMMQGRRNGNVSSFNPKDNEQSPYSFYARLSLKFSPGVERAAIEGIVEKLLIRMRRVMPQYSVTEKKEVRDRSYELNVEGRIGQVDQEPEVAEDNTTIIEIRGAI